jgi:hypothetical protein
MVKEGVASAYAQAQAEQIAADLVQQGGYEDMQDKKVIALTAYIQRLGIDISKPDDWDPYEKFRDRATKILAARNGEADKVASSTTKVNSGGAK